MLQADRTSTFYVTEWNRYQDRMSRTAAADSTPPPPQRFRSTVRSARHGRREGKSSDCRSDDVLVSVVQSMNACSVPVVRSKRSNSFFILHADGRKVNAVRRCEQNIYCFSLIIFELETDSGRVRLIKKKKKRFIPRDLPRFWRRVVFFSFSFCSRNRDEKNISLARFRRKRFRSFYNPPCVTVDVFSDVCLKNEIRSKDELRRHTLCSTRSQQD